MTRRESYFVVCNSSCVCVQGKECKVFPVLISREEQDTLMLKLLNLYKYMQVMEEHYTLIIMNLNYVTTRPLTVSQNSVYCIKTYL